MKRWAVVIFVLVLVNGCTAAPTPETRTSSTNTPFPTYPLPTTDPSILFEDQFTGYPQNWWTGEGDGAKAFYADGGYHYASSNTDMIHWATLQDQRFSDAVMSVEYSMITGADENAGAVFFWRVVDNNNFYFLQVSGSGRYSIAKYLNNELVPIKYTSKSNSIQPGTGRNTVRIVFNGAESDIYFNDHFETGFTDDSFASGEIGLGIFENKEAAEVAFDQLGIYKYDPANPYTPGKPEITPAPALREITWQELVDFLIQDHTNWRTYNAETYNCLDFAIDLVENARSENIKTWIVAVDFTNGERGHAFVAFQTSDRGTIYVEPQRDYTYSTLAVGNSLCDDWGKDQCMGVVKNIEFLGECTHDHYCSDYVP